MKKILYLLILLLFVSIVNAATTEVTLNPRESHVLPGKNAVFTITIKNNDIEGKTYTLKPTDLNWLEDTKTLYVSGESSEDIQFSFTPLSDLKPKNYGINMLIESERDKIETFLPVKLLRYDEIIDVKLLTAEEIDPRKESQIILNVKNKYRVRFDNLDIAISSPVFKEQRTISIMESEEKNESFNVIFKDATSGPYGVRVMIKSNDVVLFDQNVEVTIEKVGYLKEEILENKKLLLTERTIKKINEGNSIAEEIYEIEMNLLQLWFTDYNPEPDEIKIANKKYFASWSLDIAPNETFIIKSKTNYRVPLIYLLVILIIIYLSYKWKIKSLAITKKVMVIQSGKESVIMKIVISIRNRTNRAIKNIKITDKISSVRKEPHEFTLKPTKTGKAGNITALFWDIPYIGKKQERLISYKVECKIHNKLLLPKASVKFEDKGKGIKAYSFSKTIKSK